MFLRRDINPLSLKLLNRIAKADIIKCATRAHFLILASQNVKNTNKNENL